MKTFSINLQSLVVLFNFYDINVFKPIENTNKK